MTSDSPTILFSSGDIARRAVAAGCVNVDMHNVNYRIKAMGILPSFRLGTRGVRLYKLGQARSIFDQVREAYIQADWYQVQKRMLSLNAILSDPGLPEEARKAIEKKVAELEAQERPTEETHRAQFDLREFDEIEPLDKSTPVEDGV